jgi:hypothetical protein
MSVTKLLSLLHTQSLFFPRSDRLRDPFEGSFPKVNEPFEEAFFRDQIGLPPAKVQEKIAYNKEFSRNFRRFVAVSCWHISTYESAALWSLYGPAGETVAVQSTVDRLISAFAGFNEPIYISAVAYLDYDRQPVSIGNMFNPFLCKRQSFEHERELRAVLSRLPTLAPNQPYKADAFWAQETIDAGISVPVPVRKLIKRIFVSPTAPDWVLSAVEGTVRAFGLDQVPCFHSRLGEDPFA